MALSFLRFPYFVWNHVFYVGTLPRRDHELARVVQALDSSECVGLCISVFHGSLSASLEIRRDTVLHALNCGRWLCRCIVLLGRTRRCGGGTRVSGTSLHLLYQSLGSPSGAYAISLSLQVFYLML